MGEAELNPSEPLPGEPGWNYFNYFTEVEEHFQRERGSGLFLMSPLDWALVETWKNSGIPLAAVLRGIEEAFRKGRKRKGNVEKVNSVAYCAQAIAREAQLMTNVIERPKEVDAPFTLEELQQHLTKSAEALRKLGDAYEEVAASLDKLLAEVEEHYRDLEQLEQRLTALEDKMSAIAKVSQSEDVLFAIRRELDAALRPYRSKMSAEQLAMLERNWMEKRLLEEAKLPRLSLFYLQVD